MSAASLTIDGKRFVVMPEDEYKRMRELAREVPNLAGPPLPRPDADGNVPAVEFAQASIARKLIRDRRRAGLTQSDLARRAGIRLHSLVRIEKGKAFPDSATFSRIIRALERAEREHGIQSTR
jgi:DNA-binding XRE family transcriptional regulator